MNLLSKKEVSKKYNVCISTLTGWISRDYLDIKDNHIVENDKLKNRILTNHKLRHIEIENVDISGDYFDYTIDCANSIMYNYGGGQTNNSSRDFNHGTYFPSAGKSNRKGKS